MRGVTRRDARNRQLRSQTIMTAMVGTGSGGRVLKDRPENPKNTRYSIPGELETTLPTENSLGECPGL